MSSSFTADVTNLFDEWATKSVYPHQTPTEYEKVLRTCPRLNEANQNVLDVGCGVGFVGAVLKGLSHTVTGIDLSEEALKTAMEAKALDRAVKGDILNPDLPDQSFDVIVCWGVMMLIFDLDTFFQQMKRLLKPGGQIIISDHHSRNPYVKLHFSRPNWVDVLLEGRDNVPRHPINEKTITEASKGIIKWNAPLFHSMFTKHSNWKINSAHIVARGGFNAVRLVTKAPWTGNFMSMVGTLG